MVSTAQYRDWMSSQPRTRVLVSVEPVDVGEATKFVTDVFCGAIACFVGVTREDIIDDRKVTALEFETHPPLFHAVLNETIDDYRLKNREIVHVFVHHRIGRVPVGEGNLVIAVSSGHRKATFEALEQLMEGLKAKAPIWKKEIFDDGASRWMQNTEFNTGLEM